MAYSIPKNWHQRGALIQKGEKVSDEYYTSRAEVEYIFEEVLKKDQFKDKIIYCPFDSDDSEFTKYLNEYKNDLQLKDFWHTSDDYKNHMDLIEKADFIISNPPFSLLNRGILDDLRGKKFLLFGSKISTGKYYVNLNKDVKFILPKKSGDFCFYSPDIICRKDNTNIPIPHIYMTNIETNDIRPLNEKKYKTKFADLENKVWHEGSVRRLNLDKLKDIPQDYDGEMVVPTTILLSPDREQYEIVDVLREANNLYSDGRARYVRFIIKNLRKN